MLDLKDCAILISNFCIFGVVYDLNDHILIANRALFWSGLPDVSHKTWRHRH